jgi:hypothetical protein
VSRQLTWRAARRRYLPGTVHVILTDDPEGIARYWRERFRERRLNRKSFHLSAEDINAFRWRRYQ